MPCQKVPLGTSGSADTGAVYATEAECLQNCREGACCEGTTCSVKPACQCQGTGKVFKGVGTVCASGTCQLCTPQGYPVQGSGVDRCYCYCTVNGGTIPQFVNVTVDWSFASTYTPYQGKPTQPSECNRSGTITVSLALAFVNPSPFCFGYEFKNADYWIQAGLGVSVEGNAEFAYVRAHNITVCNSGFAPPTDKLTMGADIGEMYLSLLTPETGLGAGMCFSRFIGRSRSNASTFDLCAGGGLPGWSSCFSTSKVTLNGFQ